MYDLSTLPPHWRNYCCGYGDSHTGRFISSELPLEISYDIGMMAGIHARTDNPYIEEYLWLKEKKVGEETVGIMLVRKDYLIVSFPGQMQNFFAEINGEHEIEYVVEFLIQYRRDLLAVNYKHDTDCFIPAESPTSKQSISYYKCLTLEKPEQVLYLTELGRAYLYSLLKGEGFERKYDFKGSSDFEILSKVDSIATLLQHTEEAQAGSRMRGTAIHLIADHTLREKNLEAALNYVDSQLAKYAADTLLTPRLRRERKKLIQHTERVKEGKPIGVSW